MSSNRAIEACGQHTVLVVDDDERILGAMLELLEGEGHQTMAAPGGTQALELLAGGEVPCLALVDLMMPDMSGIELCRELKRDPRTRSMPIIIVSARIGPADVSAGEAAGASDYVKKPFDLDELRLRVRVQLRMHELARQEQVVEERLRRSEEWYRVLFENARDAIMTLEPPSWAFSNGNPAALEMFGVRTPAELTAIPPWSVSPPTQLDGRPSAEKALEMIETAMREGSHHFDWTHRRLGGEDFSASVLLTRVRIGEGTFLQATVRDLTDPRRPRRP